MQPSRVWTTQKGAHQPAPETIGAAKLHPQTARIDVPMRFFALCDEQAALCDALEEIADHLPAIDRQKSIPVARAIGKIVARAHAFEEQQLFPLLTSALETDARLDQTLERLRYEHHQDDCFAEEVAEALFEFSSETENSISADALGYMLRGFFEALRRHLAHERELVKSFAKA